MKNKSKNIIILLLVIILVFVVLFIYIRNNTTSKSILNCSKTTNDNYTEELTFIYDINESLYSYKREEKVYNVDDKTLEERYNEYTNSLNAYKSQLDDNFKYEIKKENETIYAKTYVGVSVYPSMFNNVIKFNGINNRSSLKDVKEYLESEDYKCTIRK